jgi:hypothetical protein
MHPNWFRNLSCVEIDTTPKQTEMSFHLTYVTLEYPSVCLKQCQSIWYIRHKPRTYLVPRLTLSPNIPKTRFHLTHVTEEYHQVCPKWFPCPWYIRWKSGTHLAPRLTLSSNRLKRSSTWPTSPRSTIGCVQNDFWAYGTFGANHTPNLRLD